MDELPSCFAMTSQVSKKCCSGIGHLASVRPRFLCGSWHSSVSRDALRLTKSETNPTPSEGFVEAVKDQTVEALGQKTGKA